MRTVGWEPLDLPTLLSDELKKSLSVSMMNLTVVKHEHTVGIRIFDEAWEDVVLEIFNEAVTIVALLQHFPGKESLNRAQCKNTMGWSG